MGKLLILGAGQYGFVAKEVAESIGTFDQIDFLDDNSKYAVGRLDDVDKVLCDAIFVAIGNPEIRCRYVEKICNPITLIHPKAIISPSARISEGCIIEAGAVISADVSIGKGTIIMANVVVGHNSKVGEYCQLKYNCTICENAVVPNKTKINCNDVYNNVT